MTRAAVGRTLLTGTLLALPLLITWKVIAWLAGLVHDTVSPALRLVLGYLSAGLPALDPARPLMQVLVPIAGFALVLLLLFLLGLLGSHVLGRRVIASAEDFLLRMPFVKAVYGTVRQLVEAMKAGGGRSFERVVAIEYPRKGVHALGFVTRPPPKLLRERLGREDLTFVFVPTSPNPTSGFLLIVPSSELVETGLSVEDGVKVVVSAGMLSESPHPGFPT